VTLARTWLPLLVSLFGITATTSADSAQYVVEGLALGDRVPFDSPNYQSYTCRPSDDFAGLTWCQRTQQRGTNAILSSTIIHTQDGTAIYLMANIAPVSLSRNVVLTEIDDLSRELQQRPIKVNWLPQRQGLPKSFIAVWGQIKLEELDSDAISIVAGGKSPHMGVLVDSLGDLKRSAEQGLPVYRIAGGAGYLYSASFDASGHGHRHYVAINASQLATSQFESALREILKRDRSLAPDDYQLWPDVARITRRLALQTSPKIANETLDKIFVEFPSTKLRSHAWSIIPGGAIEHLAAHEYWPCDIYGPKTEHPEIRRNIETLALGHPSDPFIEFAYYVIGEFDNALRAKSNSTISDVLHYAIGHRAVEWLLRDTMKIVEPKFEKMRRTLDVDVPTVPADDAPICLENTWFNDTLRFFNANPALYDHKMLGTLVPNFAAHAAIAQVHFEAVLRASSSPHADDAAYMLGWLAFHQGKFKEALAYWSQSIVVGNGDYQHAALIRTIRVLERYPTREQLAIVESDRNFSKQPMLWYVALRAAYREHNYGLTVEAGERGLKMMSVPFERLPATTDPKRIEPALERVDPKLLDVNLVEIPYLIEASKEMLEYETYLKSVSMEPPENVTKRARAIIAKYSMLVDPDQQSAGGRRSAELRHRDLRQALHLIDRTFESTENNAQYARLREWLYYRKIRVLAVFRPQATLEAITAMEREFPASRLLPNALAEQLYAEGVMMRDLNAAQRTFRKLVDNYPTSNAIDNAYTWMAIIFRCEGRVEDAQKINREIIHRFPLTRHARYALERMSNPRKGACGLSWDIRAR
jgi:TolA-binding protein